MVAPNISALDAWFVSVGGKPYGPYGEDQIVAFVTEGRVAAQTPVMREGERWTPAGEHKHFVWLFAQRPGVATTQPDAPAADTANAPAEEEPAKVVIIAELRSGSSIAFEAAVARLGKSYRMNQFVWLVHSAVPVAQMRKDLLPHVGRNDPLFIADTTHGRAAWLNFGPGAEATIKALWRGGL